MDTNGNASKDLHVALILEGKLRKLSSGLVSRDEVATLWSILEMAAQEFGISAENHPKSYKPMDSAISVVCRHSCSLHMELPNPELWDSLPHEVLQLILLGFCSEISEGLDAFLRTGERWLQLTLTFIGFVMPFMGIRLHSSVYTLIDVDSGLGDLTSSPTHGTTSK